MGNSSSPTPAPKPEQEPQPDHPNDTEGSTIFGGFGPSNDPTWGPSLPSKGDDSGDF